MSHCNATLTYVNRRVADIHIPEEINLGIEELATGYHSIAVTTQVLNDVLVSAPMPAITVFLLLFMSGNVEWNPGPTSGNIIIEIMHIFLA